MRNGSFALLLPPPPPRVTRERKNANNVIWQPRGRIVNLIRCAVVSDAGQLATVGSSRAATTVVLVMIIIILALVVVLLLATLLYTRHRRRRREGRVSRGDLLGSHRRRARSGCGGCGRSFFGAGSASADDDDEADIAHYHRPSLAKSSPPSSPRSVPPRYANVSQQHLGTGTGSSSDGGRGSDDVERQWSNDEDGSGGVDNRSSSLPSSSTSSGRLPRTVISTAVPDIWLTMAEADKRRLDDERETKSDVKFPVVAVSIDEKDSAVVDATGSDDDDDGTEDSLRKPDSLIRLDDELDAESLHSASSSSSSRDMGVARLSTIDCDTVDDDDDDVSDHVADHPSSSLCSAVGDGFTVDDPSSKRFLPLPDVTPSHRPQIDVAGDAEDDVTVSLNRSNW